MRTTVAENESESKVTVELVKRVSRLVAKGIPLELAIAVEPVTQAEYEEQLRCCPELAAIEALARIEFLERAMTILFGAKNPGPNIRWWLETFYPEIFGERKDDEPEGEPAERSPIVGLSLAEVEAMRAAARLL